MKKKDVLAGPILLVVLSVLLGVAFKSGSATPQLTVISASSSTNVSGYITTNTTWTLVGSPYVITADVIVTSNVFLTIEPGVVVKFVAGTSLVIDGGLIARGNSTPRITFTSNATARAPGDWGSIRIRSSGLCNITNSIIEYATTGLDFESLGSRSFFWQGQVRSNIVGIRLYGYSIILDELAVERNTDSGIYVDDGDLDITNSLISNNNIGIKGNFGGILTINNCTVSNNTNDGISTDGTPIDNLLNSRIIGNGGRGLSINRFLLNCNNTIVSNNLGGGIYVTYQFANIYNSNISMNDGYGVSSDSGVTISGSIISNNSIGGVSGGNVNIEYTSIMDNGNIGVTATGGNMHFCNLNNKGSYEVKNTGSNNINATYNWWSTTDVTLIRQRIYDYYDDPSLGEVSYVPFLNSTKATLSIFTSGVSSDEPVRVQKDGIEIGLANDGRPLNLTVYSGAAQFKMGTFGLSVDKIRIWDQNSNIRYKFVNWTGPTGSGVSNSITVTVTANSSVTAFYKTQYLTNFTFKDYSGNNTLYAQPVKMQLIAPNGSLTILTSFQNQWLDEGKWAIKQILWQGSNVKPVVDPTYTPIAGGTWIVNCRVYAIDFTDSFEDSKGTALYVKPSSFDLIFPNGTTSAPLNVGTYLIQNGTTTWNSILWQGSEVAPTSTFTFDAANGNPTIRCRVYSLAIQPVFYDNTGIAPVQPSSWSIEFPNGTVRTVSSPIIYNQTQAGNYSIASIIWKGGEVVPLMKPTKLLTSDTSWFPSINCLLPTRISISLGSSTSYIGFKVEIHGNLTCNDAGLSVTPILLSYSVNNGESWNDITLVNTALDGTCSAVWMPSATGNYLVKATWTGNATYPETSTFVNLAVTPFEEKYVFTVESNSTISELAFNTTGQALSFTATGPNGTRGYTRVTLAKSLIANATNIRVYLDGKQTQYSILSTDDSWLLTFNYTHSAHHVIVDLQTAIMTGRPLDPTWIYITMAVVVIALISGIIIIRRKKQKPKDAR